MQETVVNIDDHRQPSILSKLETYQRISRKWAPVLHPSEVGIALWVVDHTVGWSRGSIRTTVGRIARGTNISRRSAFKYLANMEEIGLLYRSEFDGKTIVLRINHHWEGAVALPIPKSKRGSSSANLAHQQCTSRTLITDSLLHLDNTLETDPSDHSQVVKIEEDPGEGLKATIAVITDKPARTPATAMTERDWIAGARESCPQGVISRWTRRDMAQMKRLSKTFTMGQGVATPAGEFLFWATSNWPQIMATEFKWMTDSPPPAIPSVGFFVRFISNFMDCWSKDNLNNWMRSGEGTEFERLTSRGMTRDQAMVEIAKRRAVEIIKDEMTKRERKVRVREQRQDNPMPRTPEVHPLSQAAGKLKPVATEGYQPDADELARMDELLVPAFREKGST